MKRTQVTDLTIVNLNMIYAANLSNLLNSVSYLGPYSTSTKQLKSSLILCRCKLWQLHRVLPAKLKKAQGKSQNYLPRNVPNTFEISVLPLGHRGIMLIFVSVCALVRHKGAEGEGHLVSPCDRPVRESLVTCKWRRAGAQNLRPKQGCRPQSPTFPPALPCPVLMQPRFNLNLEPCMSSSKLGPQNCRCQQPFLLLLPSSPRGKNPTWAQTLGFYTSWGARVTPARAKSCQTPTSDPISKACVQGERVITYDRKGIEGLQMVIDDFV